MVAPILSPLRAPLPSAELQPASQQGERTTAVALPQSPPITRSAPDEAALQARLRLFEQQRDNAGNAPNRALRAYQSLGQATERERISQLLGIDEYA